MAQSVNAASQTHAGDDHAAGELNELRTAILAFERQRWTYPGARQQSIKEVFDMTSTRYYQVLNGLIDEPQPPPTTRCSSNGGASTGPHGPAADVPAVVSPRRRMLGPPPRIAP